jgi:hypothetical protein
MELFAMIYAIFIIAVLTTATFVLGVYAGRIWGAGVFALLLLILCQYCFHQSGPNRSNGRDTPDAFQQSLADL